MTTSDLALEKGLPANLDAERLVLGSILLDQSLFVQTAGALEPRDFCLDRHRLIFSRMADLHEQNERIDRVTLTNELLRRNELEKCGGISYVVSLDDGLPPIFNLESYLRNVKEKSILRQIIFASQNLMNRCLTGEEGSKDILASVEEGLLRLGESRVRTSLVSPGAFSESAPSAWWLSITSS